ncbi:CpXC domain-containing protein [Marispirochaeta sp.]|jgi:hypothetical protein|uniref:CpXC domain-containing protein n=1 Tax=Marispirochaeta sp. TaxID=2038653 RepID=UPI0029C8E85E|nr:CpXC domain-containing protein [Marispirochaeta sp.]
MDHVNEHNITCYCEQEVKVTVPEIINLENSPEKADEIIQGEFLKLICPNCGKELKPEFEIVFHFAGSGPSLLFLPEIKREAFYKGQKEVPRDHNLVIGYPELREFLLMNRSSLDRFSIEAIKLHLLQKAPSESGIVIYFEKIENEKLIFEVIGLRKDEVGIVQVPLKTYHKLVQDKDQLVQEEPYNAMFRSPYISVKLVSFEEAS